MRVLLLAVLGVALFAPTAPAQTEDVRVHEIPHLTVTIPASYEVGTHAYPIGGGQSRTSYYFFDSDSQKLVAISTRTGLSWWQRFRFHRGWGVSKQTPHAYHKIAPDALGLSPSVAELVGSAYFLNRPDADGVGIQIRGCQGDVCYSIGVGDPQAGGNATFQDLAPLLAGIEA
ncbi:MAG: hypothetical protein Rubg2KO_04550 [Rubricoccaceae bacterium]